MMTDETDDWDLKWVHFSDPPWVPKIKIVIKIFHISVIIRY